MTFNSDYQRLHGTGTGSQAAGIGTSNPEAETGTGYREARNRTGCQEALKSAGSQEAWRFAGFQEAHKGAGYREAWKSKAGYHFPLAWDTHNLLPQSEGKGYVFTPPEIGRDIIPNFQFKKAPATSICRDTGYKRVTVKAPATSICLTRESGLKPLMKYEFEVRSRNAECEGKWSRIHLIYIGMYIR